MKTILMDLRGQALTVLISDGKTFPFQKIYDRFSPEDEVHADEVLDDIKREIGGKLDRVHLILPFEHISRSTQRIPLMSRTDAEKVIRRKISRETGSETPIFQILPIISGDDKKAYIVESINRDALSATIDFFRDRGIRVKSATTALQANVKSMSGQTGEPSQTVALIDLEKDYVEVTIWSGGEITFSEALPMPPFDKEKEIQNGKTLERIEKMRVYRMVEAVYTVYSSFQSSQPETILSKIWITGSGAELTGIDDVLKESLGADVALLNPIGDDVKSGIVYTSLYGLNLGLADKTAINFLSRKMSSTAPLGKTARTTLVGSLAILLIVLTIILEMRYHAAQGQLKNRQQKQSADDRSGAKSDQYFKNRQLLERTAMNQTNFYALFGYLADNTPDGMFINGMDYRMKADVPFLDIEFISPYSSEVGNRKLLTQIISMIDRSTELRRRGEPSISIIGRENSKLAHFKVTCEVVPYDKAR